MSHLFQPLSLHSITLKNRIAVSPMCQYSSEDGFANHWHLVHLGSRAVGGAAIVFTEATAVSAEGRISPQDLGIYKDEHITYLQQITTFVLSQGAIPGMQLAHAGRKASTKRPWAEGPLTVDMAEGGWQVVAPSAIAFSQTSMIPHELSIGDIKKIIGDFKQAAERALQAGFKIIEIHSAHGYLLHEFLSPLSNQRTDEYGGSLENRMRLLLEVTKAVRDVWQDLPLFVRISATDWETGGWNIEDSVKLARVLKAKDVDLIDVSSGGTTPHPTIPFGPGYQTPFAERIRNDAGIATGAVGMIIAPEQADHVIRTGQADIVLIAREMLREPYWPLKAGQRLGHEVAWPNQYKPAKR